MKKTLILIACLLFVAVTVQAHESEKYKDKQIEQLSKRAFRYSNNNGNPTLKLITGYTGDITSQKWYLDGCAKPCDNNVAMLNCPGAALPIPGTSRILAFLDCPACNDSYVDSIIAIFDRNNTKVPLFFKHIDFIDSVRSTGIRKSGEKGYYVVAKLKNGDRGSYFTSFIFLFIDNSYNVTILSTHYEECVDENEDGNRCHDKKVDYRFINDHVVDVITTDPPIDSTKKGAIKYHKKYDLKLLYENPEDRTFRPWAIQTEEHDVVRHCPMGHPVPPSSKFCEECGSRTIAIRNTGKDTRKLPFEDVFQIKPKDSSFVLGELEKGTVVLLLGETDTCVAETTDTELFDHPNDPLKITKLKMKDKCRNTKYFGALIGVSKAKYQFLKVQPFADRKLAQRIALEAPKFEHPQCPEYLRLSRSLPILWLVPDQKEKLVIAQMKRKSNNGPLFLHKNDHTYALAGRCVRVHEIKTFSVNDRIYLRYIATGCDGGIYEIFVYDLSGSKPTLIYSNGSWST